MSGEPRIGTGGAGVDDVLDRLRARGVALRVWSIVITVFGDAIAPRGGVFAMRALQTLTTRLGIEPNALRTAMSRLASDGWLVRQRRGRMSYYTLSSAARLSAQAAAARIYAPAAPAWRGTWLVCFATGDAPQVRERRRAGLADAGFSSPRPDVYLRPDYEGAPEAADHLRGCAVFSADAQPAAALGLLVEQAWPPEPSRSLYRTLLEDFDGVAAHGLNPLDAMAQRTLLVHQWRRALLKDASLPATLRPADWPGESARAHVAGLYRALICASESWLDRCHGGVEGALPEADDSLGARFKDTA